MPRTKPTPQTRNCRIEFLEDRRLLTTFTSSVVGRHLFYNDSKYDGYTPGFGQCDYYHAIATDKSAYLPGGGLTLPSQVSAYSRGINGIAIDLGGTHGTLSLSDFEFAMSEQGMDANNTPSTWAEAPAPTDFTVLSDVPAIGYDRVEFIWDNNAIENRYLEVTVKGNDAAGGSNTNTGLARTDVFYYGNRIGDTFLFTGALHFVTDGFDESVVRGNPNFLQPLTNIYDFDKSGSVTPFDVTVAQENHGLLNRINISGPPPPAPSPSSPTPPPAPGSPAVTLALDPVSEWSGMPVPIAPNATITGTVGELTAMQIWMAVYPLDSELDVTAPPGITKRWDGSELLFTGVASLETYEGLLRTVTYHNTDPLRNNRTIEWAGVAALYEGDPFDCHSSAGTQVVTPTFWVDDATATKSVAADDPVEMEFTISLSMPSSNTVSVHYATQDGTAVEGIDYEATSGDVTFAPGVQSETITVPIIRVAEDMPTVQPDKTFSVVLSNPQNALLTEPLESIPDPVQWGITEESSGTGTIFDSAVTDVLPDGLAEFSTSAFSAGVVVDVSASTGEVTTQIPTITGPLAERAGFVYTSASKPGGTLSFRGTVPSGEGSLAYSVDVSMDMDGGESGGSVWGTASFERAGGIASGTDVQLILPYAMVGDIETGTYTWEVIASYSFDPPGTTPPSEPVEVTYHGVQSIVNRADSPYGAGMWIAGLDQLFIQDEPEFSTSDPSVLVKPKGITYVADDATTVFFAYNATTAEYVAPRGHFLTLTDVGNGYLIENPLGTKKRFSGQGLLQQVRDPDGNATTYQHNGDDTLQSITDPFQQTVSFGYTSGELQSITDAAGRETQIEVTSGQVTRITSPPPKPSGTPLETTLTTGSLTLPAGERVEYARPFTVFDARIAAQQVYVVESIRSLFLAGGPLDFITDEDRTATVYDAGGNDASMKIDSRGWVVEYTDFEGHTTKYEREDNGLVKSITLPGETEPQYEYTYDNDGNLLTRRSKATVPGAAGIPALPEALEVWTYNAGFGVADTYTDPPGNVTNYDVDGANGQVREIHKVAKSVIGEPNADLRTKFTYTPGGGGIPAGLIATRTDPKFAGTNIKTRYDYAIQSGQLIQTQFEAENSANPLQRKYIYELNTMNLVEYVDERQKSTNYEYDDLDRLKKVLEPSPDGVLPRPEWEYHYLPGSPLLFEAEDPRDHVTTYVHQFYSGGSLFTTEVILPEPIAGAGFPNWKYQYDTMGRQFQVSDPRNKVTNYEHDKNGNLTDVRLPTVNGSQPHWQYEYNSQNLLESARDPEQNTTNYFYDNRGQLERVLAPPDPVGTRPRTLYAHDNLGRVTSVQDPMGRITSYGFNSVGWLEAVVEPSPGSGQVPRTTYSKFDKNGNTRFEVFGVGAMSGTESLAQTTEYQYDDLNRLRSVIQPAPRAGDPQPTTEYTYYDTGQLHTLTDPNDNTTTWGIDNLGRVVSELDPLGKSKTFEYDAIGNLEKRVDRKGRMIKYDFDALNRMTDEHWFTSTAATTPLRTLSYRYDLADNLTSAFDPAANYTFVPDDLGRVERTDVSLSGVGLVELINEYDQNNNRTRLTTLIDTVPDFVNNYGYDNLDRLVNLKQVQGSANGNPVATKQVGFSYNAAGQMTNVNRFNQIVPDPTIASGSVVTSGYIYDDAGRLKNLTHTRASAIPVFQSFSYDALDRLQLYINSLDQPVQHNYRYDHNNQVIWEFFEPETTYDYDSGGNRIETNGVASTPGAGNRLLDDGTYTYAYDDEGNLVRRIHQTTAEQRDFFWDHRNRLVQVQSWTPGFPAEAHFQLDYKYDVFDRRVSRMETTYINGGTFPVVDQWVEEKYIYDGDHVVLDFKNVDGAGHQLARRYLYGAAVDQVLAQENLEETLAAAARVYWLLPDNQGSIRDIADNTGAQVAHYMFDAFGRIHSGEPTFTRYLYTGREFDATSGLQYNRNRWYDPTIGRFISEDPIGFAGGDTNLGRYVGNSGPNGTDPYGLAEWPWSATASWNLRDTLSLWTGGFIDNQAQFDESQRRLEASLGSREIIVGAAPNPAMLVDGVISLLHEMGYGEQVDSFINFIDPPPPEGLKFGMAPPIFGKGTRTVGSLRAEGVKDAHHVIQDAAVRGLRGYDTNLAPGVHLAGPSTATGTPHYIATLVQRQIGGGTYAAERRIAYKALRRAGFRPADARQAILDSDEYFRTIGVGPHTRTRIPGNRTGGTQ